MTVLGKSSLDISQLLSRKEYGITDLELQLIGNETDGDIDKVSELVNSEGLTVYSVHQPIYTNGIITDFYPLYKQNNIKVIEIANKLCNVDKPVVVLHAGHYSLMGSEYENSYDILENELEKLIQARDEINKNIIIGIENSTKFTLDSEGRVRYSYDLDARNLADLLCKYRHRGVMMVLDTCHLFGHHRSTTIVDNNYNWLKEFYSDLDYILNKGIVKYIHLNNSIDVGLSKLTHSTIFKTDEDIKLLNGIIDKLREHNFEGLTVAEVLEEDYTKPINTVYSIDLYNKLLCV